MYYCNEIKSMSVLSLCEGELLGVVDKLFFDKKLKKLLELEVLSNGGNKLILPVNNIYNIGKNAITIKNNQCVKLKIEENELRTCPIGSKAYTINGEYLGIINEIIINEKYLSTKIILNDEKVLDINNVLSCGNNAVIFIDEKIKLTQTKKQNIFNKIFKNNEKNIKNEENFNKNNEKLSKIAKNDNFLENKNKKIQNMDFLIGRICTKDILNFNNETLIKSQTKITKNHLIELNKFGKLHELMIFSK